MHNCRAAIDLGTNTARLLIGGWENGQIRHDLVMRRITRLGGGFSRKTGISADAWERSVAALKDFALKIREHNVIQTRAVATSAVRDAANRTDFCKYVFEETGIELEVIDGETEGELTLKGVLSTLDSVPENLLVFDVGGGSTEYTIARNGGLLFSASLPLGVVRLTEGKVTVEAMTDKIERELEILKSAVERKGLLASVMGGTAVGTAGTATTLASISMGMMDYDYRKVNNYSLSIREIASIFDRLLPLTPRERLKVPGLEEGREDLIIAGILLTMKTLQTFGCETLKVSDFGLLEGVLLSICR